MLYFNIITKKPLMSCTLDTRLKRFSALHVILECLQLIALIYPSCSDLLASRNSVASLLKSRGLSMSPDIP